MTVIEAGGAAFSLSAATRADTPRAALDEAAAAIGAIFAARERAFGFGPGVIVEYPPIADPETSPFLADPAGHIAARVAALEPEGPVGRVVVLTTFGAALRAPLAAAGYACEEIDMPAGPDDTWPSRWTGIRGERPRASFTSKRWTRRTRRSARPSSSA